MAERKDKPRPEQREGGQAGTPHLTAGAQADKAARQARLAAEMRKNLVKRKRQQRARDDRAPGDV